MNLFIILGTQLKRACLFLSFIYSLLLAFFFFWVVVWESWVLDTAKFRYWAILDESDRDLKLCLFMSELDVLNQIELKINMV